MVKQLPDLKEKFPWLKETYSHTLVAAIKSFINARDRFLKKLAGRPNFKTKGMLVNSFSTMAALHIDYELSVIYLPKLATPIRAILHKKLEGKIKNAVISRSATNKYYLSISIDNPDLESPDAPYGTDNSSTLTLSNTLSGDIATEKGTFELHKQLEDKIHKLLICKKRLKRTKAAGKNNSKAKLHYWKAFEDLRNKRDYIHYDIIHKLLEFKDIDTYLFREIPIQSLKTNPKLFFMLLNIGYGDFKRKLTYKAQWMGKNVESFNTKSSTKKLCSHCETVNHYISYNNNVWFCEQCSHSHDDDENNLKNIKKQFFTNEAIAGV